ncbi:hypothetical protein CRU86_00065 [Aliarcobacter skirrowii]|uniref:hypothetical protein n=1 Tax=Aliarcobacter skirrowii TaxID=28200 RepID=UPI00100A72D2|nr:hypothetical protein [Aliarcobacter skirrowii]RXJ80806.1 hypothetical protein CRU86_00065 [Aliarcobacter skirrowii]
MNFLKQMDSTVISIVIFSLLIALVYFYKDNEVNFYKDKLYDTQDDLIKEKTSLRNCENKLDEQNEEIESFKIKIIPTSTKLTQKVQTIYIKDKSCESELKAYKELFND